MIELSIARARAEALCNWVRGADCVRAEIGGSIRRGKPEVKDIEIIAEPYIPTDLFGVPLVSATSKLDAMIDREIVMGRLKKRLNAKGNPQAYGQKFKALATYDDIPIDLFIVRPPAQWGAVFAIRTGPGDFSKYLVTACQGMGLRCEEGRLVRQVDGSTYPTPTEESFFQACGVPWIEPEKRK